MSTTLILFIITIIMIVLILLNLFEILPTCVGDETKTAESEESGWKWRWVGWPAWYTLGWGLDSLTERKELACWPRDNAPWYLNIRFMAFIQFMMWVVAKEFIPSTFGGFPILVLVIASLPVLVRYIYLTAMVKQKTSTSSVSFTAGLFTLIIGMLLPFFPIISRELQVQQALEANCHEIFELASKMGMNAASVLKAFGIKSKEDLEKHPSLNKCVYEELGKKETQNFDPDEFVKLFDELVEKVRPVNHQASAWGYRQMGGKRENAWHKHIISHKLSKQFKSGMSLTSLLITLWERNAVNEIISAVMNFNVPVPYMPWWRFGLSDLFFTGFFAFSILIEIGVYFLSLSLDSVKVPKTFNMIWNSIPGYYAIGGQDEKPSNIFYLIYLFRIEILIAALIGLIMILIINIGHFIMKNIKTIAIILLGLMVAGAVLALFADISIWLWMHALRYPFYIWPKLLLSKIASFLWFVIGGFFQGTGELVGLFADMIFGSFT